MANPNPKIGNLRPFKKGQSGNVKGRPRKGRAFEDLTQLIDETPGALRAISKVWLKEILRGNPSFFREYLDRSDGKTVPAEESHEIEDGEDLGILVKVPTVRQAERKAKAMARKASKRKPKGESGAGTRPG